MKALLISLGLTALLGPSLVARYQSHELTPEQIDRAVAAGTAGKKGVGTASCRDMYGYYTVTVEGAYARVAAAARLAAAKHESLSAEDLKKALSDQQAVNVVASSASGVGAGLRGSDGERVASQIPRPLGIFLSAKGRPPIQPQRIAAGPTANGLSDDLVAAFDTRNLPAEFDVVITHANAGPGFPRLSATGSPAPRPDFEAPSQVSCHLDSKQIGRVFGASD